MSGDCSFDVNERTAAHLVLLQDTFGVKTKGEVLRKAVALAIVLAGYADDDGRIHIASTNGKPGVTVGLSE